jgi:hypothetical protein
LMNMGSDCRQPHSSSPCIAPMAVSTTVISSLHATKTTLHVSRHSLHLTDPPYQLYCVDFVGYEAGTHQTDTDGPLGDHGTSLVDSLATPSRPSYIPPPPPRRRRRRPRIIDCLANSDHTSTRHPAHQTQTEAPVNHAISRGNKAPCTPLTHSW